MMVSGERRELARYRLPTGERVLYGATGVKVAAGRF